MYLPLANLMHYKLRSALSALGIGIGVATAVTLSGLSRGSLHEVADRWESVDADLIVFPHGWGENASDKSGSALSDRYAGLILARHGEIVERATPVFTWQLHLAGQDHLAAGVDPDRWHTLTGGRRLVEGRLFDPHGRFARWLEDRLLGRRDSAGGAAGAAAASLGAGPAADEEVVTISPEELGDPAHNGLELVIDTRLAKAGGFRLGQTVTAANHRWTIVGIVPAGAMTRVFLPRRTAQYLFGSGDIQRSTLIFVKLRPGADPGPAARAIQATTAQDVVPLSRYRGMLQEKFGILFIYVDAVNAVALTIAFLFIMVSLYTMVLQRTREIAILKSCGASDAFILRQVVGESAILTAAGTAVGLALSVLAGWGIEAARPLLTVRITWGWIGLAVCAAACGAVLSALYPAWRATRVDVLAALTLE